MFCELNVENVSRVSLLDGFKILSAARCLQSQIFKKAHASITERFKNWIYFKPP